MEELANFDSVVGAARIGDAAALTSLYQHYHPRVLRYLNGTLGGDAEDAASEVWISVSRSLHDFRGDEEHFRRWLFTIAARRRADVLRTRSRDHSAATEPPERPHWDPDVSQESWARDLIRQLPDEQAEIILLRVVAGLDAKTVGEIVGKSPGAVRVTAHRAVQRLRRLVETENVRTTVSEMPERERAIAARRALAGPSSSDADALNAPRALRTVD